MSGFEVPNMILILYYRLISRPICLILRYW